MMSLLHAQGRSGTGAAQCMQIGGCVMRATLVFNEKSGGATSEREIVCALASAGLMVRRTIWKDQLEDDLHQGAEVVIVATPTDYDERTNYFDTSSVEQVVGDVRRIEPEATVVVKSTVPVGFTRALSERLGTDRVIFSPEFLREGRALHDNLHPSRVVVGDTGPRGRLVADLLAGAALDDDVPVLLTGSTEAEAVKKRREPRREGGRPGGPLGDDGAEGTLEGRGDRLPRGVGFGAAAKQHHRPAPAGPQVGGDRAAGLHHGPEGARAFRQAIVGVVAHA